MAEPAIVLERVSKIFSAQVSSARPGGARSRFRGKQKGAQPSHNPVGVFDVSLRIPRAQTFVLMGLSGSGKSTLLRLLNRLLEPTGGRVIVAGTDIARLSRRQLVGFRRQTFCGMVFQGVAVLPYRTALQNVAFGLELRGVAKGERLARAREALELMGMAGREEALPGELSGGMQQRLGLARALVLGGDILLMDEPFSALDPLTRRELQDELVRLQARLGKTVVFVTHDLSEALKVGHQIALLEGGRVQQVGTPEEVVTRPANAYVASFVAGVDKTSVLTASSIMTPPNALAARPERPLGDLEPHCGPDTPLAEVIRICAKDPRALSVVGDDGRLLGTIAQEAILSALAARPHAAGLGGA